jgi:hypothetical protein
MDEKNEKAVKNIFSKPAGPMGRGVVWCGDGLRRLLNRIFLGPGRIWLQSKADRAQEGTTPGIPTDFLLWQKPPGRLNGGNLPRNGQIHPKRGHQGPPQKGSSGVQTHPEMVPSVVISKLSKFKM